MALIDPAKMIKVVIKGWNKSEEYYIKDFDTAVEELKKIVEKKRIMFWNPYYLFGQNQRKIDR